MASGRCCRLISAVRCERASDAMRFDGSVALNRQMRHLAEQPINQAVEQFVSASDMLSRSR